MFNTEKFKEEVVMHYADLLGVKDLVTSVKIYDNRGNDSNANVFLSYNDDDCHLTFFANDGDIDKVTVLHEIIHMAFKNTTNSIGLGTSPEVGKVINMLLEQETDRLAKALALVLPEPKSSV